MRSAGCPGWWRDCAKRKSNPTRRRSSPAAPGAALISPADNMPRSPAATSKCRTTSKCCLPRLARHQPVHLEEFNAEGEGALFLRAQRADADHFAGDFLALLIADRHDHRVLRQGRIRRLTNEPVDTQRHRVRPRALLRSLVEAEVVLAGRADGRAFEDRRLAVRTGSSLAGERS